MDRSRQHPGVFDVTTWRIVPAENNPTADEYGQWAVIAGEMAEDPDLYVEFSGDSPKRAAEFVVHAVREQVDALKFSGVAADVECERRRERARFAEVTPGNRLLPDALKLACLTEQLGELAREITDAPVGGPDRDKRLYSRLTSLAAGAIGWMESIHSREDPTSSLLRFAESRKPVDYHRHVV